MSAIVEALFEALLDIILAAINQLVSGLRTPVGRIVMICMLLIVAIVLTVYIFSPA